jgi:hypothetical protein
MRSVALSLVKGGLAGEGGEEHGADGVDVGAGSDLAAAALLGGHEERGALDDAGGGEAGVARGLGHEGDAEVEDLDAVVGEQEDVLGLHVAVDDRGGVGGLEAVEDRVEDRGDAGEREGAAVEQELAAERDAGHQLHDDERGAALLVVVEDGDDVGVAQAGEGPGLAAQAGAQLVVHRQLFAQQLDGDGLVDAEVGGAVDGAKAALTEDRVEAG